MITYTFNGMVFTARTEKGAKILIRRFVNEHGYKQFCGEEVGKCFYCDNDTKTELVYDNKNKNAYVRRVLKHGCMLTGCRSKTLNSASKEFLKNCKGYSDEEVIAFMSAKGKKGIQTQLSYPPEKQSSIAKCAAGNNVMSYEYLMNTGLTREEAEAIIKEKNNKGLKTKRDSGFFEDPANNPYSKAYWIKRGMTPEEAQAKVNSRNLWCNSDLGYHNPATKEFWFERDGNIDGYIRLKEKSKYNASLEGYKEKYGEEEGTRRFLEVKSKRITRLTKHSKESSVIFKKLYKELRKLGYTRDQLIFGINDGELFLKDQERSSIYYFDFCVGNAIIEYNGFTWHPRKSMMTKDAYANWKNPFLKERSPTAEQMEEKDARKVYIANKMGYSVLEIWDFEVKESLEATIKRCLEFIHEKA